MGFWSRMICLGQVGKLLRDAVIDHILQILSIDGYFRPCTELFV